MWILFRIIDIGDTQTCKIYLINNVSIDWLLPIINDQLTSDKIFAGAQL